MNNNIFYELPSGTGDNHIRIKNKESIRKISSIKKSTVQNCILSSGFLLLGFVISLILIPDNVWIPSMAREHCAMFDFAQIKDFAVLFPKFCLNDMAILLLIALSSLTFFSGAINSVVISLSAMCFGIGIGGMKCCTDVSDGARIAYIIHIFAIMLLFCIISSYALKFNRVFTHKGKYTVSIKSALLAFECRQLCFALSCAELICVIIKLLYCAVMNYFCV